MTNENSGALPGNIVFRSDAFLSNFALGSDASAADSLGNISSHELNILKPDGSEIATGTVHEMAAQ